MYLTICGLAVSSAFESTASDRLDDVPELDKKLKHSIEAVVDRLKTRPDQRARMAESLKLR